MSETNNRAPSRSDSGSSVVGALFRNLLSLFFIGVSVMCVYNVFGVGGEVEAMAKETACQGQPLPCNAQYTRAARTPWAHTFKMYTSPTSGEKDIECMRQYVLLGDYSCKVKGAPATDVQPASEPSGPSGPSGSDKPASSAPARFPAKAKATAAPRAPASAAPAASQ